MFLISQQFILSMMMFLIVLIQYIQADGLIEVFRWKQMDFYNRGNDENLNENAGTSNMLDSLNTGAIIFPDNNAYRLLKSKRDLPKITSRSDPVGITSRLGHNDNIETSSSYIPYSNVPMGVTHFNGRLFITMPRRRIGIPSTLNYIDIQREQNNPSPKLHAYPNYRINSLNKNSPSTTSWKLISVYRTTVDACKRLWFIDTGMLEYPGDKQQIQRPSIWAINLLTNEIVNRFVIPQEIVATGEGLASITIDVTKNNCDQAFAYIPDLLNAKLYVYSLQENRIWRFNHNYFNFDPVGGDLTVGGQRFRWDDGIFSITLGPYTSNGFRIALFHAMASTNEFMVSTEVLRNETNSQRSDHRNDFMLVGNRGPMRQSTMHEYDPRTGVIFYAEIQRNGVGCWNTNNKFSPENHGTVAQDSERMIYPSDLTIDDENTMWLMTNSMPIYIYSSLDPNVVNFRVWKRKTTDAIKNTICD